MAMILLEAGDCGAFALLIPASESFTADGGVSHTFVARVEIPTGGENPLEIGAEILPIFQAENIKAAGYNLTPDWGYPHVGTRSFSKSFSHDNPQEALSQAREWALQQLDAIEALYQFRITAISEAAKMVGGQDIEWRIENHKLHLKYREDKT